MQKELITLAWQNSNGCAVRPAEEAEFPYKEFLGEGKIERLFVAVPKYLPTEVLTKLFSAFCVAKKLVKGSAVHPRRLRHWFAENGFEAEEYERIPEVAR